MLAIEPVGELALPDRNGVRFLGMQAASRGHAWRTLRHVFEVQGEEGALFIDVGPLGFTEAYAVGYTFACEEILLPL